MMKKSILTILIVFACFGWAIADGVKISEMTELAADPASDDELAIVDTSETETKRITWSTIESNIVASAGDSATAFFSAGTIEHERGGLEADVNAYDGLLRITGGATSAVTLGIANGNVAPIDSADAGDDEYVRFTASGFEGRNPAELTGDLSEVSDSAQGVVPSTSGASDGDAAIVQGDGSIAYEALGAVGIGKHMAKMTRDAAQSIPNNASTKIEFDNIEYDIGGIADITTNYRFDIARDGKYEVFGFCRIPNLDDNEYTYITINVNGDIACTNSSTFSTGANNNIISSAKCNLDLDAGDYIELYVYHNEGASQDTSTTAFLKPSLSITQLDGVASGDRGPVSVTCSDGDDTCAYVEGYGSYYLTSGSDTTADTMTISDGFAGQKILFRMVTDSGDDISVEFTNGTDCTDFDAAGDYCYAEFDGTNWFVISQGP